MGEEEMGRIFSVCLMQGNGGTAIKLGNRWTSVMLAIVPLTH